MWRGLLLVGTMVLTPVVGSAQQPCTTDARQVVTELYQRMFERSFNPDAAMVEPLASGQTTVRELAKAIVNTPEYRQRYLSGSREAGVTALYRHLLGRQPDGPGLQVQTQLANAQGYEPVIEALLSSREYTSKFSDNGVPGSSVRYCGSARGSRNTSTRNRYSQMDRNNDGVVQRSEWTGTAGSFATHDWNGDNVLSGDELRYGSWRGRQQDEDYNRDGAYSGWDEASFNQMDRNNDGRVSSREWYSDSQSFVRADRNRDGYLSQSEFLGADNDDDDRGDQFDNLDANGNGYIDRREWHGGAQSFERLDRDNDNLLSRSEMVGSSRGWDQFGALDVDGNGRLTPEEWRWSRRSFTQQDTNGDGVLSRREFTSGGGVPTSGR